MIPFQITAFEELTVLDTAGRLQIPKAFLEKHQMRGRVRVELTDQGILILPANHREHDPTAESLAEELTENYRAGRLHGLLRKIQNHRFIKGKTK